MESLSFQYPAWYLLLCVLLGGAYAAGLYYKDKTFAEHTPWLTRGLSVLRFLAATILAILLLQPLLRSLLTETKKPVVILAQDVSESVGMAFEKGGLKEYQQAWGALKNDLGRKYEVKEFSFGSSVREGVEFTFDDKVSNISSLLGDVSDLYGNQNLGAVVLATDGIYNEGSSPLYAGAKLNAPVYTVGLGDTLQKKDLVLKRVFHNNIAYLGDKFSVQVDVAARNCAGSTTSLNLAKVVGSETRNLQQMRLNLDRNDFFTTSEFTLDASEAGVQHFRISMTGVAGEVTTANNSKDIFVDVLDARQKILLLANSPNPDISALKQTLEQNKNYEVTTAYINELKANVADFDFVLLHNLPSRTNDAAAVLNVLDDRKIARMFIVGTQTNLPRFNQVQPVIEIQANMRNTNDVQGAFNPNFSLFTIDEALRNNLPTFNPLTAPFGEFQVKGDAQVLLYQRIGKVDTKYPLLVYGHDGDTKVAVLAAEGVWRWKLFDYLQHQNHDLFGELIGKNFQYTALKADKRRFRVSQSKNIFNENEPVVLDAELYNESYELVNEADVSLKITNSDGRDFNYTFNKTIKAYTLTAGVFPVGNYRYKAQVILNGQNLVYDGKFSVQPIQLEVYETTADHAMLRRLSEAYGGVFYLPNQLSQIGQHLLEKDIKPVMYSSTHTQPVIHLKWIFFLLLGMLSLEWFLRRYYGGY
ncbi:MAG: hypothetical protein EPO28_02790 [Saprospiraceae bacterium]|nr:MAG: hypothetical protein EPO28_02790 [Saprospiraceae bacterium]